MKKVVIFTEQLYGGGVERILQIICKHFDYSKYAVTIYTIRRDRSSLSYFPPNIRFRYVFNSIGDNSSWWNKICCKFENKIKLFFYFHINSSIFYKLFIREKTDIAIAFIEGYATKIVSGFPKQVKKMAWLHIELQNFHWSKVAFRNLEDERRTYLSFDKIVCVSQIVKYQIDQLFHVSEKSIVLYNPIDQSLIKQSALIPIKENIVDDHDVVRMVTIGTLNERKGQDRLLKIFSKLLKEGYNIELWIIGLGEKYDELSKYIEDHYLNKKVKLLGYKENPFNYLNKCNLYVCSSFAEGYNTAITEALVLGKAVVSTECSGVKEQLGEHNEWGICVENSEEGLYEGLKEMLNPETLDHYTKQAIIRGRDFTLEKSMNEIYQLIDA